MQLDESGKEVVHYTRLAAKLWGLSAVQTVKKRES